MKSSGKTPSMPMKGKASSTKTSSTKKDMSMGKGKKDCKDCK